MKAPYQWVVLRVWLRYRKCIQIIFVFVAIAGYCLLLGNYAIANYEHASLQGDKGSTHSKKQHFRFSHRQRHAMPLRPYNAPAMETQAPFTPLPVDLAPLEAEYAARRARVQDTCDRYGLNGRGQPNAWEFFIDSRHHLVWCNVFKAASSTWMYYFNLLGGYKENYLKRSNKVPLVLARTYFPRPSVSQLRSNLPESLSFFIVREPFERLLSAFRNKIESFRHRFYRKMAHEMIAKYRKPPANGVPESKLSKALGSPTFSEFVSYITDAAYDKKNLDEHWAPFYSFCTPCLVNFTVIAKLETFDRDQEYIIQMAHIDHILKSNTRLRSPRLMINKARGRQSTKNLVEKYFSQLTLQQVERLYAIYEIDFEMFGYNATKYFHMASKSESYISK